MMECEACRKNDAQVCHTDLYDKTQTYLCKNCEVAYVNLSLTKKQFFNMIKSGHTTKEFMLHSDFYDEEGVALQGRWF